MVPKFNFQSSESFSIFFSLKNINLGSHFLLLTSFDSVNFQITFFSKTMPNLTPPHYTNSQNSIIFFGYVDF